MLRMWMLALCALVAFGGIAVAAEPKCDPLCELHKRSKKHAWGAYKGPLVCVRGVVAKEPTKVTVHFIDREGKPYRIDGPHTFMFQGEWRVRFGRHWFERVKREGGIIRVCAGEDGIIGARFEDHNIDEHLKNGPACTSEPICLFPGLDCPE